MDNRAEDDETLCDFPFYGEGHRFHIGQPLWVFGDKKNCWIPIGFYRAMWSEWYCVAHREGDGSLKEHNIPLSWLTDLLPGEKRYNNVVMMDDYRRPS